MSKLQLLQAMEILSRQDNLRKDISRRYIQYSITAYQRKQFQAFKQHLSVKDILSYSSVVNLIPRITAKY